MSARRKNKAAGGGFLRGLVLFVCGVTGGIMISAMLAVYINELHLPFIEPPTRKLPARQNALPGGEQREQVEFHDILRNNQPTTPQPVETVVDEEDEAAPTTQAFVYYIQLASFQQREAAEAMRGELTLEGERGVIRAGQNAAGDNIYRVWLGPYAKKDDAESKRGELALRGKSETLLLEVRP